MSAPTDATDVRSNYIMGKRLCVGLGAKLEGDAKKWLEGNKSQKKPIPHCWRKHRRSY